MRGTSDPNRQAQPGTLQQESPVFGELLRQFRRRTGLTQEELAERANLSTRGISDLERGVRRKPHKATIGLLADALDLPDDEREQLHQSARRQVVSPAVVTSNLPVPMTSFVGRRQELDGLRGWLLDERVRLLTLTGTAGVGKSRLAIELAREVQNQFTDGVCYVRLVELHDPSGVPEAIAESLARRNDAPLLARGDIIDHLRSRQLLLVLDDFEHVMDASPVVAELLQGCPGVKVLMTSRRPSQMSGEHMQEVTPLPLPDLNSPQGQDDMTVLQSGAVQLFIERAQAIDRQFRGTDENVGVLADICRGLDGLPLAIELAAARTRMLSPQEIQARLDRPFELLRSDSSHDLTRQRALRSTLEWSYQLLGQREQSLFARLAVCAGGCDLDAVERICGDDADTTDVFDRLSAVVDSSLMTSRDDNRSGRRRFRMLRTVKAFAEEKLRTDEREYERALRLHASHYLRLAERAATELLGPRQSQWYRTLEAEHDNLDAALDWALVHAEAEFGLKLANALWRSWEAGGRAAEGLRWFNAFLQIAANVPSALRVEALNGAGLLACAYGDDERAEALLQEALRFGTPAGEGRVRNSLGVVSMRRGDYVSADLHFERSIALARAASDEYRIAIGTGNLGIATLYKGDIAGARRILRENLGRGRRLGLTQEIADTLNFLGYAEVYSGHYTAATHLLEESLRVAREAGNGVCEIEATRGLGCVLLARDQHAESGEMLRRALDMAYQQADVRRVVRALDALGSLASARGDRSMAIGLWLATDRAKSDRGVVEHPVERAFHAPWRTRVAAGKVLRRVARTGGHVMSIEEAISCAMGNGS